jgi:hypothetical protein
MLIRVASRAGVLFLALVLASASASNPDSSCQDIPVPFDGEVKFSRTPDSNEESGFFVPATLEAALVELAKMLPAAVSRSMYCGTEHEMVRYHHSLGRWMRNHWGLWAGGPLAKHFVDLGITHSDNMSGIILTSYWRQLHGRPIDLDGQIEHYLVSWEAYASPGPFTCPSTGELIEPTIAIVSPEPPQPSIVHHVVDCGDGEFWSYERSEGWRPASEEILERVNR